MARGDPKDPGACNGTIVDGRAVSAVQRPHRWVASSRLIAARRSTVGRREAIVARVREVSELGGPAGQDLGRSRSRYGTCTEPGVFGMGGNRRRKPVPPLYPCSGLHPAFELRCLSACLPPSRDRLATVDPPLVIESGVGARNRLVLPAASCIGTESAEERLFANPRWRQTHRGFGRVEPSCRQPDLCNPIQGRARISRASRALPWCKGTPFFRAPCSSDISHHAFGRHDVWRGRANERRCSIGEVAPCPSSVLATRSAEFPFVPSALRPERGDQTSATQGLGAGRRVSIHIASFNPSPGR